MKKREGKGKGYYSIKNMNQRFGEVIQQTVKRLNEGASGENLKQKKCLRPELNRQRRWIRKKQTKKSSEERVNYERAYAYSSTHNI